MKILIDFSSLGPNKLKVISGAESADAVLEEFYVIMKHLFPACCVDRAITDLAYDIEREEMEAEFADE
tara:strand:+ start:48 stop:251 length:204 start_codon:yes stop_codon:yes gene_type:complete